MKINWKIRVQNPKFWFYVGLSIFTPVLTYYGVKSDDLTTWGEVIALLYEAVSNPQVLRIVAVSLWSTIQNPTTRGLGDSDEVLHALDQQKQEMIQQVMESVADAVNTEPETDDVSAQS